jgi:ribose-phosphate pyrophosphokinase
VPVLIALPDCAEHARRLGERLGLDVVTPEIRQFPDGELYVRIDRDTVDEAVIVGNLVHDNFLRIAFLAGTARDLGAKRVGLVTPYLAYMRQDSRFARGEGVTATYFGRLVSGVVDWMVTVDPHLHRLDSLTTVYSIPTTVARAAPSIAEWVSAEVKQPVLVGPDAESVQWVSAVAERCGAPYLILEKTRRGDRDVAITAPEHAWNGHTPVVIDDIVSTGRTMLEATRQLRAAGTAAPMCVAIHAVFADAVAEELLAAGARGIVTCNTISHASNRICITEPLADAVRGWLG